MNAIELRGVSKRFNGVRAVDGLTFTVQRGEVFGLLGPNGAGKSTTIRILMDIIKPDAGDIRILDQPMSDRLKDRIGYLPEERGLYRSARVLDTLVYLGQLKGMSGHAARAEAQRWLARVELADWGRKKLNELSKGMQQKVQFVATILHAPDLVILDEPFSGLDPLNIELVKDIIRELEQRGTTVILSTHQLAQAEAMCRRLLLIHHGRAVLYGELADIRARYTQRAVRLDVDGALDDLPGVGRVERNGRGAVAFLSDGVSPQDVLRALVAQGREVRRFELATPPLDAIFIAAVEGREQA